MNARLDLLAPRPREMHATGGRWRPGRRPTIAVAGVGGAEPAARTAVARLEAALRTAGLEPRLGAASEGEADVRLTLGRGSEHPPQGYRLRVGERGARIDAGDGAGLFYGAATLLQWLALHRGEGADEGLRVPGLAVEDHPSLAARGVLLDVSRNRVPTMDTLFDLVDRLAGWKINQLQLYTEHTFAYRGHEAVWRDADPLTGEEIRALDRHCAARHVELVPNQNSFGHLHRWLRQAPYRELAECPEGVRHPFSGEREPFSLCPLDPRALELLEDLYGQLLPHFSSRRLHVGFDETFDLGRGRSATACAERGVGRVYLDFLHRVAELAARHGRTVQVWADVLLEHPELLTELPPGTEALAWGYEAGHPFVEEGRALADAGVEFTLCPGTSSWISFAGRWHNALVNLAEAAVAAAEGGAAGYLVTDWGDLGHLQPLAASYPGLLAGACFAWNAAEAERPLDLDWPARLDRWAFGRPGAGAVARELGNLYLSTGVELRNGTVLARLLLSPEDTLEHPRYEHLTAAGLERAGGRLARARARLRALAAGCGTLELDELDWAAEALEIAVALGRERLAAGRAATLPELPAGARSELARRLTALAAALEPLWLARNRPGGLAGSRGRLERLAAKLSGPA